ncbi:hypothetical protein [Azospirillum sp. TSO22-1]|uniref:hypothetical protein n=1 Tax=Azospirillum sp. TSO22-1 TaxID=716789 RepID=UPI000D612B33|nr:hypothetical protein [Azospirillum sp. TSO22-1]PWC53404.1 hypothetical protein TSO221_10785 [Azospirillum sp. TSO22-1]
MASFKHARPYASIRTDALSEEKRAAIQEGLRDLEDGLGVPLAEVEAWVESWDTSGELPMPQPRAIKGLGRGR